MEIDELVESYIEYGYDDNQIYFLLQGYLEGIDVSHYANDEYDALQMEQIYLGLKDEIYTKPYENKAFSSERMKAIRIAITRGTFTVDMLDGYYDTSDVYKMSKENEIGRRKYRKSISSNLDIHSITSNSSLSIDELYQGSEESALIIDDMLNEATVNSISFDDFNDFEFLDSSEDVKTDELTEIGSFDTYEDYYHLFGEDDIHGKTTDVFKNRPLLSAIDEKTIGERIERGDSAARLRMIEANYRLVYSVAKKYATPTLDENDLFQIGIIGLITAVNKWDYKKGFKFSTYATHWIRQVITRYISDYDNLIRIPVHKLNDIHQLKAELNKHCIKPYVSNSLEILSYCQKERNNSGFDYSDVIEDLRCLSLLESFSYDSLDEKTKEMFFDSTGYTDHTVNNKLIQEAITRAIAVLPKRSREILILRFGLYGNSAKTLEEVGAIYKLTRERIRQIESKALRKLKHPSISKELRDFVSID